MTQDITFKVKRSKVNLQGAGRGHIVAASRTTLRNSLVSSCCSPVALIHCEVWGSEPECRKNECSYSFSAPDSLQFYSIDLNPVLPALTDSFETAVIIPAYTCSATRKLCERTTPISVSVPPAPFSFLLFFFGGGVLFPFDANAAIGDKSGHPAGVHYLRQGSITSIHSPHMR